LRASAWKFARSAWKHARKRMKTGAARGRKADRTHRRRPQASLKFRKELEEALKDSLRRWWDRNQELPEKVAPMST
jgi:hypothetical protein